MSGALRVDRTARELFNKAAIAAGMSDKDLALEVCRDLGEVEAAYELRLRVAEPKRREAKASGSTFTGRPMHSRFPSRCVVCSGQIAEGTDILYSAERKRAAHLACGEVSA